MNFKVFNMTIFMLRKFKKAKNCDTWRHGAENTDKLA